MQQLEVGRFGGKYRPANELNYMLRIPTKLKKTREGKIPKGSENEKKANYIA
jgi:hypothetical protein